MRNLIRLILSFALLSIATSVSSQIDAHKSFDVNQFFSFVLQGNVKKALEYLDATADIKLHGNQKDLKNKIKEVYTQRFVTLEEEHGFDKSNPVAAEVVALFQSYWRDVLMNPESLDLANEKLEGDMLDLLNREGELSKEIPRDSIIENIYTYTNEFLKSNGLYANAMGKTSHIYDIYLWKKEVEKEYEVELPETHNKLKVVFMEEFICKGWAHYASFGNSYTGGWATTEALYCLKDSYDLSSEKFLVSYLKHEAQHYADNNTFPQLRQADKEYRAKLAELSFAKESIYEILSSFQYGENDEECINPHAFADYCVIRDLSMEIFNQEHEHDMAEWEKISYQEINKASRKLFKEHTAALMEAGAETVTGFIQ